ncbi:MAG TPA: DUF72 domain-containing protein [Terriglobales bacterium]|nr:DUF72 domain-containing protein [Terriglobales bacterium]
MSIHIGPAGWAYKDWEGTVYPSQIKKEKHPVEYLAQFFDLIEINTSFYGRIRPEHGKLWSRRAKSVNPDFLFTAKLNKAFTHSPVAVVEPTSADKIRFTDKDEDEAKAGFNSLAEEGTLGAVLMQFPISFKNTEPNRDHLELLIRQFREYPLAVEVRHSSWSNEGILAYFERQGVAFCNIDQPLLGQAVKPSEHVTAPIGYVRLHGRRYDQWFDPEKPSDRYDYLYNKEELTGWKTKIENVAKKADVTFVVANNHFEGKAPANALELRSMLTGGKVKAPEMLVQTYPRLREISEIVPETKTTLF